MACQKHFKSWLTIGLVKRTRAREEVRALVQRRENKKEILLARSVLLRCSFPLAQEGLPFLFCIYDEHNHVCNQCYGKKYSHAPRIAWNLESAFCNDLTAAKQICKARGSADTPKFPLPIVNMPFQAC